MWWPRPSATWRTRPELFEWAGQTYPKFEFADGDPIWEGEEAVGSSE